MGANYVRAQIIKLAPNGISSLEQIEYKSFKASKNRNEEYYRRGKNALKTVVKMYSEDVEVWLQDIIQKRHSFDFICGFHHT